MTISPVVKNPAPLLTEVAGFASPKFTADISGDLSATGGNESYGSGWDFLWKPSGTLTISAVPEPATGSFLLAAGLLLCGSRFRKKLN